ncbi:MAG: GNAT family N-acetyltransferase [Chitinophagales bacterium]
MEITTAIKSFDKLSLEELYGIIHLREKVFVVEQNAAYQDTDYKDQKSWHVMLKDKERVVAYARVIPQGISYKEASIGRVVSDTEYRKLGLGRKIMEESLKVLNEKFKTSACRISAQTYLVPFYKSYGFKVCSTEYLEDGLPHYEMIKE